MSVPPLRMTLDRYGPVPCDFQQGMQVRFDITVQGDPTRVTDVVVSVLIYDPAGRLFRRLSQAVPLDGEGTGRVFLMWDGRDAEGRRVPPGRDLAPTFSVSGRLPDGSRVDGVAQFCSGLSSVAPGFGSRLGGIAGSLLEPEEPPRPDCLVTPWHPSCRDEVVGWWPPRPPVPGPPAPDRVDPGPGAGPPPGPGGGLPPGIGPGGETPPFDPRPRSLRPVVARPGSASGTGAPGSACPVRS